MKTHFVDLVALLFLSGKLLADPTVKLCNSSVVLRETLTACHFLFDAQSKATRHAACIFFSQKESRIALTLVKYCVNTTHPRFSVRLESKRENQTVDCSGNLNENEGNKHEQPELEEKETLKVAISVTKPQNVTLRARATLGSVKVSCSYSKKETLKNGEMGRADSDANGGSMGNVMPTSSSPAGSVAWNAGAAAGSLLVVTAIGISVFCIWTRKRSSHPVSPSAPNEIEDLDQREATPEAGSDDEDYDRLGCLRKPGGASADTTYGHLELDGDVYSHVQRGASDRPLVIKGGNLYGHLSTSAEDEGEYDHVTR